MLGLVKYCAPPPTAGRKKRKFQPDSRKPGVTDPSLMNDPESDYDSGALFIGLVPRPLRFVIVDWNIVFSRPTTGVDKCKITRKITNLKWQIDKSIHLQPRIARTRIEFIPRLASASRSCSSQSSGERCPPCPSPSHSGSSSTSQRVWSSRRLQTASRISKYFCSDRVFKLTEVRDGLKLSVVPLLCCTFDGSVRVWEINNDHATLS